MFSKLLNKITVPQKNFFLFYSLSLWERVGVRAFVG
jgi:hypothetical protein